MGALVACPVRLGFELCVRPASRHRARFCPFFGFMLTPATAPAATWYMEWKRTRRRTDRRTEVATRAARSLLRLCASLILLHGGILRGSARAFQYAQARGVANVNRERPSARAVAARAPRKAPRSVLLALWAPRISSMGVLGKAARVIGAAALALRSVHSLQVEVIAGNRTCPATSRISADDGVQMRYTGPIHASSKTGVVGKEFDSSARLPGGLLNVTLGRGELVKGWERGLVDLCEGARATFVVEPELAYG